MITKTEHELATVYTATFNPGTDSEQRYFYFELDLDAIERSITIDRHVEEYSWGVTGYVRAKSQAFVDLLHESGVIPEELHPGNVDRLTASWEFCETLNKKLRSAESKAADLQRCKDVTDRNVQNFRDSECIKSVLHRISFFVDEELAPSFRRMVKQALFCLDQYSEDEEVKAAKASAKYQSELSEAAAKYARQVFGDAAKQELKQLQLPGEFSQELIEAIDEDQAFKKNPFGR